MPSSKPVMLITGSRKGIGKYLARYYAEKGYRVEGISRKAPRWRVSEYHHHLCDVTDESGIKAVFSSIRKRHGRLDVAINNAGIAGMNHSMLTPLSSVERIFQTNLAGTFLVCRESAKLMRKMNFGRIINFSTVAVPMALEGEAAYAASKSAVELFSKIVAKEFSEFGITCNVVGPTPIETDLIKAVPQQKIDQIIRRLTIKRLGRFQDVANVIDFFILKDSDYITGQTIYLGGVV